MRNTAITISRAFAVILLVVGAAGVPTWLGTWAAQFHAPLLFVCFGYGFRTEQLEAERAFALSGIKRLYVPFIKWSALLLCLQGVFLWAGFVGQGAGAYSWHEFSQRLWSTLFNMSGYDEQLAEPFWYFRAMLVAGAAFFLITKLLRHYRATRSYSQVAWCIIGGALFFASWQIVGHLGVTGLSGGGGRELLALYLVGAGFLLGQNRELRHLHGWPVALACLCLTIVTAWLCPTTMTAIATLPQLLSFVLPSVAGFLIVYKLSSLIAQGEGILRRALTYVGDHYLCILAFHLLAFKPVACIEVWTSGRPWQSVASLPVVSAQAPSAWCLLYIIAGIGLPLLFGHLYHEATKRFDLSLKHCALVAIKTTVRAMLSLIKGIRLFGRAVYSGAKGAARGVKDIINASNPKDE